VTARVIARHIALCIPYLDGYTLATISSDYDGFGAEFGMEFDAHGA
jgi:hypothetical protein